MLFLLSWLSCYILRTTTQTTYTTKNVVLVVLVVVLYFKDDNWNNLYNQESCRGTKIIAHLSENVNLVVINIDKRRRENRSEKALRRAKNANRRHTLGERISCLGERKSCRPNSGARSACPAAGRRGRLAGVSYRIFRGFNERLRRDHRKCFIPSKAYGVMLALFSVAGAGGGFRGNFRGQ